MQRLIEGFTEVRLGAGQMSDNRLRLCPDNGSLDLARMVGTSEIDQGGPQLPKRGAVWLYQVIAGFFEITGQIVTVKVRHNQALGHRHLLD